MLTLATRPLSQAVQPNPVRPVSSKSPNILFGAKPSQFQISFWSDRYGHALSFATKLHRNQPRPGDRAVGYNAHIFSVAGIMQGFVELHPSVTTVTPDTVIEKFEPGHPVHQEFPDGITLEDAVIAALLHDAIEDQHNPPFNDVVAKIESKFGPSVLKLVQYCTTEDIPGLDYNENKRRYLEKIAGGPSTALLIAASDKLHNLRSTLDDCVATGQKPFEGFSSKSPEEKLQYYKDVVRIFGRTGKFRNLMRVLAYTLDEVETRMRTPLITAYPLKLDKYV